MDTPKINALGITQEWSGTSWKATGDVEGVGGQAGGREGSDPARGVPRGALGVVLHLRGPAWSASTVLVRLRGRQ